MANEIRVQDNTGAEWPNLRGVFRRVFPIVVGEVVQIAGARSVYYHGERFTISAVVK